MGTQAAKKEQKKQKAKGRKRYTHGQNITVVPSPISYLFQQLHGKSTYNNIAFYVPLVLSMFCLWMKVASH